MQAYKNPMDEMFPMSDDREVRKHQEETDRAAIENCYRGMVQRSLHAALAGGMTNGNLDKLQAEIRNYERSYPFLTGK